MFEGVGLYEPMVQVLSLSVTDVKTEDITRVDTVVWCIECFCLRCISIYTTDIFAIGKRNHLFVKH